MVEMMDDIYKSPKAELSSKVDLPEYTFYTLGVAQKILLVMSIFSNCIVGGLAIVSVFYGAFDFGFVIAITNLTLATLVYRSTVERKFKGLLIYSILQAVPGFNIIAFIVTIVLAAITYAEIRKYA